MNRETVIVILLWFLLLVLLLLASRFTVVHADANVTVTENVTLPGGTVWWCAGQTVREYSSGSYYDYGTALVCYNLLDNKTVLVHYNNAWLNYAGGTYSNNFDNGHYLVIYVDGVVVYNSYPTTLKTKDLIITFSDSYINHEIKVKAWIGSTYTINNMAVKLTSFNIINETTVEVVVYSYVATTHATYYPYLYAVDGVVYIPSSDTANLSVVYNYTYTSGQHELKYEGAGDLLYTYSHEQAYYGIYLEGYNYGVKTQSAQNTYIARAYVSTSPFKINSDNGGSVSGGDVNAPVGVENPGGFLLFFLPFIIWGVSVAALGFAGGTALSIPPILALSFSGVVPLWIGVVLLVVLFGLALFIGRGGGGGE